MRQLTLRDFFDFPSKPDWYHSLLQALRNIKADVWNIDILELLSYYSQKMRETNDLNQLVTGLLICSVLAKQKSRYIGIKELEALVEEEIKEEKEKIESFQTQTFEPDLVSLDSFVDQLKKLSENKRKRKNKNERKKEKKEVEEIHFVSFEEAKRKVIDVLISEAIGRYFELLKRVDVHKGYVFPILLFLHEEKIIELEQEEQYSEIFIKLYNE